MSKKDVPHLVFRKQPTIVSEDPFKTEKEETALAKLIAERLQKYEDKIAKELKSLTRELAAPAKLTSGWDSGDLVEEGMEYAEKGYAKGVILSSKQLAPLNVKIDINMSNPGVNKTIKDLRGKLSKRVDEFGLKMQDVYEDIVYRGIESGKTFDQIMEDVRKATGKGITEANQIATEIIVNAARKAETETFLNVGIEIFRWITVTDSKTCETCLALNGQVYRWNDLEGAYINMDSKKFLYEELEDLASEFGVEDWIVTDADGPPIHHAGECRCHFQPVMTYEQYQGTRGSDKIKSIVSEV